LTRVQLTLKTASSSGQYWGYFVPACGGVGLERKNGDAWIRIDQGPWPPCNDIAYGYGGGSKTKVDLPLSVDLPPGPYRVTTGLWTDSSQQLEAVSSPFEVERAAPQKPPLPLPVVAAMLRERRARVKNARRDEHVDIKPDVDVRGLVGFERAALEHELGAPDICDYPLPAPCDIAQSWYFIFHHLPATPLGGGTMLHIAFDPSSGRSASAIWVRTK
jgi:hypothetical protein